MGKKLSIYDFVFEAYKLVLLDKTKVATLMLKKTHFLSYVSFVELFENETKFSDWLIQFYSDMPDEYIGASKQQTTSLRNISKRMRIVKESIDKFLENG